MSAPLIIGITGHARSGKDTVAQILCEAYGFKTMSFADPLKADLIRLDPIIHGPGNIRVSDVLKLNGWSLEALKEFDEWRELCQRYGTDVWRENDPDVWVERLRAGIYEDWIEYETPGYVVPDVRFPNERSLVPWSWMIKVERPGIGAANEHEAEKYIDELEVDFVLQNDGTIEDLVGKVLGYVNSQLEGSVTYEAGRTQSNEPIYFNRTAITADDSEDLDMFRQNVFDADDRCPQDPEGLHFYRGSICVYCDRTDPLMSDL